MKVVLFSVFLLLNFCSYSQTKVSGFVKDQSDSLLFGDVLLLSPSDSSLISGFYFDNGQFSIESSLSSPALLKISSYGFEDTFIVIRREDLGTEMDLGVIILKPAVNELGDVEVTASLPLFTKSAEGGLIVNVQKTMLGSSTSVLEVLSKSPNISINGSTISVVGKGEALLYKNGKRITFEQLGSISVQSLEKIEIITNPSAKYDAEGRAVINFILAVNPSEGFEVGLVQNFIIAKHFLWAPAVSLNYRKNKFSVNGNYSISLGKDWNEGIFNRTISTSSGSFTGSNAAQENTRLTYVGNHSVGLAYQFNAKNDISVEYSGMFNVFDLDVVGSTQLSAPSNDETQLSTHNLGNTTNNNNAISLNYNRVLDTLGSTMFIGGQYTQFNNSLNDIIDERIFLNGVQTTSATRNNVGSNDIRMITGRIDIAKNLKNGMSIEFGGKYGDVTNVSAIDLYSKSAGQEYQLIAGYSNNFEYYERIPAVYTQWKTNIGKKANLSLGARGEYSMITGVSNTLNQTVIDTTYLNIFPNATINYTASDKWSYSLAYAERIARPKYQDLDPFLWYQDSLSSVQGNPYLLPELIKGGEVSAQYKTYSLTAGYNHSKNPSRNVLFEGTTGDGSVLSRRSNFQFKDSWFSTVSLPFEVKFWKSFNTITLTLDKYIDDRPEFQVGTPSPQLYVYSYHRFKVKKWFNVEAIFDYEGARNDGIYQDDARYSVSVGLAKYLLGGDLTLRFLANDVLQTYRETGNVTIGNVTSEYDRKLNTVFYRFSVIYFIGKLRNVSYQNKRTGEEEFDRVKK